MKHLPISRSQGTWIFLVLVLLALTGVMLFDLIVGTFWISADPNNYLFLLILNSVGIVLLSGLIGYFIYRLIRQHRERVPGTQLTIRFLRIFAILLLSALGVVYSFSFLTISRGIDSWFELQLSDALNEATQLRELFIDSVEEKLVQDLTDLVDQIAQGADRQEISEALFVSRNAGDYEEITYFGDLTSVTGIIASAGVSTDRLVPQTADPKFVEQALATPANKPVGRIVPGDEGGAMLQVLLPVKIIATDERHYLQVISKLPPSSQRLAERIGTVNEQYKTLVYLRKPLKINFVLTLSLVTLLVLLLATWGATLLTQRLVSPIHMLSEGTQQVAKGIYEKLPQVAARDDLGVLVESFNEMTRRIKLAQEQIHEGRTNAERQRWYLEVVLKHLSSGVLFIDVNLTITEVNLAAERILGIGAMHLKGSSLAVAKEQNVMLAPFFAAVQAAVEDKQTEWSDTVTLDLEESKKVLACSSTQLPLQETDDSSYVVVVEDITDMVNAQRGLAWARVAERMSHELLTPLQPIRLAVDRIRLKTQKHLPEHDSESLELAYDAINRQLNSMQRIVNDFRDYRGLDKLQLQKVDLNSIIRDVVVMLSEQSGADLFDLDLHPKIDRITADSQQIVRVLNNLITNAVDAVNALDDSWVKIATSQPSHNTVRLQVLDNGSGFPNEVLEHLFEPYVSTKKKGVGLGLGIVKKIIDRHQAKMSVANRAQGGAEICIEFEIDLDSAAVDQNGLQPLVES